MNNKIMTTHARPKNKASGPTVRFASRTYALFHLAFIHLLRLATFTALPSVTQTSARRPDHGSSIALEVEPDSRAPSYKNADEEDDSGSASLLEMGLAAETNGNTVPAIDVGP